MLHGLGDREFYKHLATERQHHDEERKPAPCIAHRHGSVTTPVDLRALAGSKVQLEIDRPLGWSDAADLLSAVGVRVQQPCDARLEGIKDAAARPAAPRLEARSRHPRRHGLWVEAQRPRGLPPGDFNRQAFFVIGDPR